ncbi:MAG: hypothetical protein MZV63_63695 [Marinilabiliales bacterium]|nr:hypothetical protein [Marinilabiliales bacterium]
MGRGFQQAAGTAMYRPPMPVTGRGISSSRFWDSIPGACGPMVITNPSDGLRNSVTRTATSGVEIVFRQRQSQVPQSYQRLKFFCHDYFNNRVIANPGYTDVESFILENGTNSKFQTGGIDLSRTMEIGGNMTLDTGGELPSTAIPGEHSIWE